jgi:methyl-accepting chemotaxis protein
MSKESKEVIEKVRRTFEVVKQGTDRLAEETVKIDKELSQKIQRVKETSEEVVKHIEERSN